MQDTGAAVPPHDLAATDALVTKFITPLETSLSVDILFFGAFVLLLLYLFMRSREASAKDILALLSVVLVVTGSLFLVTAGFSSQQIAPAFGLFGTIIGYVIGNKTKEAKNVAGGKAASSTSGRTVSEKTVNE